ncbi:MAG: PDZ domain-containing protein, partial [Actinobacteria bacterium]|nr:PDZ domain-containing protein [Actinomycetota bacterium]
MLDQVQRDFYRKINVPKLANTGLAAAVDSLNDPYSHYYSASAYRSFQNEISPHLSGIGVNVSPDPRGLLVSGVFPESPAERAGLAHGDLIVAVGATQLAHRSADFASGLIKGKAGTPVTLTVVEGARRRVVRLIRANLSLPVASSYLLHYKGTKLGELLFTRFTQGSGAELRVQVDKMIHAGAKGLILDLRGNGGGLLEEAVNVASIFIADGTIVSTAGRSQPRQVYLAKGGAIAASIPLVVLVNADTASSAEIVTAALQDRRRAKVVGTHTYGKGVFQEIQSLSNGGALEITVGEFFTPKGRNLGGGGDRRGAGVTPDVLVDQNPRSPSDDQLNAAER